MSSVAATVTAHATSTATTTSTVTVTTTTTETVTATVSQSPVVIISAALIYFRRPDAPLAINVSTIFDGSAASIKTFALTPLQLQQSTP